MSDKKKVNPDTESNENVQENTEELNSSNKYEESQLKTSEELLTYMAEDFSKFVNKNIDRFVWKSISDIFFEFLLTLDSKQTNILQLLEERLGRPITFDDIKHLYLSSGYTLFEDITEKIFKKLKNLEIVKNILNQFISKITQYSKDHNIKLNIDSQKIEEIMKNSKSQEDLFRGVRAVLLAAIKELPPEEQEKIKNLKLYNYEIIEDLFKNKLITPEEYEYLKWDITKITEDVKNKINLAKLLSLQSVLLNSNFLSSLDKINTAFNKFKTDLEEIFNGLPLWKILGLNNKIKNIRLSDFPEEIWNLFTEEEKNNLKACIWKPNETGCIWKNILQISDENKKNKILNEIFLSFIEDSSEGDVVSLFKKIIDNKKLSKDDVKILVDKFYPLYKEKLIKVISSLSDNISLKNLEEVIDFIFKSGKGKLKINQIEFDAESNFDYPNPEWDLSDILNSTLNVSLKLYWDNISLLEEIYPNYFVKIKDKIISKFSKTTVKFKDWTQVDWYVSYNPETNKYEIYSYEWADLNPDNTEPVKTFSESDIENILVWEQVLNLNWWKDISKLAFNMNYIQGVNSIKTKTLDSDSYNKKSLDNLSVQEKKEKLDKFKEAWKNIFWDENIDFKEWVVLSVKWLVFKSLPWVKKNWYNFEIVNIDEENLTWTIKPFGWLLKLEWENKLFTLPIDDKLLEDLKFEYNNFVYKFKKANNLEWFIKNLNANISTDNKQYEETLEIWKKWVKKEWNKLVNENWEEIKYIGRLKDKSLNNNESVKNWKHITEFIDVLKVNIKDDKVILTHPFVRWFSKVIDYNTFLMIIMDNYLEPWTEKQYNEYKQDYTSYAVAGANKTSKFWKGYYSIWNLIYSFKELWNAVKNYLKEEDDFRAAELLAGITSLIPHNVPVLGDLSVEATAEKEAKIWKRITSAKERLARADKWWNHAKVAARLIEKEIFKPVMNWEELSYKKKLRAAWYLLYALEKWPSEYFRALAPYAGKGIWVKALFGQAHYEKWLLKKQQLEEELKKDPDNEDLRNELVFSEINYMKDIEESAKLYSANFASAIEGWKINVYSDSKVNEVLESERTKSNYFIIYDWFRSYLLNNRWANSMWALKALSERVETDEHYVDYYKVHLIMTLTGFVFNDYNTLLKEQYEKICRIYWIPLWLYAWKYDGIYKILTILDTIVKIKNIKPWGKETLTEYLYWKKDPSEINIFELKSKKIRAGIIKKLESFWAEYGDEIVRVLDYRDPLLFNPKLLKNLSEEQKSILEEYFQTKVNDSINEDFAIDLTLFKTAYSPYYSNWVFNLGKQAFSNVWWISEGKLKAWDLGKNVWKSITRNLQWFIIETSESPKVIDFILSKYLLWLGEPYNKLQNKKLFLQGLLSKDKDLLKSGIIDVIKEHYGHYYTKEIPVQVEEALEKMIQLIEKTPIEFIAKAIKNKYSTNEIVKAVADLKDILPSGEYNKLLVLFNLNESSIEKWLLDKYEEEIEELVRNFIIEELKVDNTNLLLFTKLFFLIKGALLGNRELNLEEVNLSDEMKNKIEAFINWLKNRKTTTKKAA